MSGLDEDKNFAERRCLIHGGRRENMLKVTCRRAPGMSLVQPAAGVFPLLAKSVVTKRAAEAVTPWL